MRVHLEAYGCALNRGEARELMDAMVEHGIVLVEDREEPDASVLFTCGVIETTERRMLKRLGELAQRRRKLIVCGCLSDIVPDKITKVAPKSTILRTGEHLHVLELLNMSPCNVPDKDTISDVDRTAPLPIASGCVGKCTYCVTRRARGPLKSRNVNDILERGRNLVSRGVVELQLCAQDTAIYGKDSDSNLLELVTNLSNINGDFMMRVGMMTPSGALNMLENILDMYNNPRVFKFLHLPVQSGSDIILESMRRGYVVNDFRTVVQTFKKKWPDGMLSTDIIVGFPGENEEDFSASKELIKEIKPDIVNVTRFSSRPGTVAANLEPRVPGWVVKERSRSMTDIRFSVSMHNNQRSVGMVVPALATERRVSGTTFLRDDNYRAIVVGEEIKLGLWYRLRITGAERTHLLAALCE